MWPLTSGKCDITHWISHTGYHTLDITHSTSHTGYHREYHKLDITHSTSHTLHNGVRGVRELLCQTPHIFPALHVTFNAFDALNGLVFFLMDLKVTDLKM